MATEGDLRILRAISAAMVFAFAHSMLSSFTSLSPYFYYHHTDDILRQQLPTANLISLFGAIILSCLFLAKGFVVYTSHPIAMVIGCIGYCFYIAIHAYAVIPTIVPTAILAGAVYAIFWTGTGSYVIRLATEHARKRSDVPNDAIRSFSIVIAIALQFVGVIKGVVNSTVLKQRSTGNSTAPNESFFHLCGIDYCPDAPPPQQDVEVLTDMNRWIAYGVLLGVTALCLPLVFLFVMEFDPGVYHSERKRGAARVILGTCLQHLQLKQWLLAPLAALHFQVYDFFAQYQYAWVQCVYGTEPQGYLELASCLAGLVILLLIAPCRKLTRPAVFAFGCVLHLGLLITLLSWRPDSDTHVAVVYVIACSWGVAGALIDKETIGIFATAFKNDPEAAFASLRLWQYIPSLSVHLAIIYGSLCVRYHLYILLCLLVLGTIGLYVVDKWETPPRWHLASSLYAKDNGVGNGGVERVVDPDEREKDTRGEDEGVGESAGSEGDIVLSEKPPDASSYSEDGKAGGIDNEGFSEVDM